MSYCFTCDRAACRGPVLHWLIKHGPMVVIAVTFVVVLGVCAWGIVACEHEHERLMTQCLADGRKEYECVALLNGHVSPVVVPQ